MAVAALAGGRRGEQCRAWACTGAAGGEGRQSRGARGGSWERDEQARARARLGAPRRGERVRAQLRLARREQREASAVRARAHAHGPRGVLGTTGCTGQGRARMGRDLRITGVSDPRGGGGE